MRYFCQWKFDNFASFHCSGGSKLLNSSGCQLIQSSVMVWAILVEGYPNVCKNIWKFDKWFRRKSYEKWPKTSHNPKNISSKLFENPAKIRLKHLLTPILLKLWQASCSAERSCLSNFGRGSPKEHFCKIIWKYGNRFRRSRLKHLLIQIYLQLWWPSCSAKRNGLTNFL